MSELYKNARADLHVTITARQEKSICAAYDLGVSLHILVKRFKVKQDTIKEILVKHGRTIRTNRTADYT